MATAQNTQPEDKRTAEFTHPLGGIVAREIPGMIQNTKDGNTWWEDIYAKTPENTHPRQPDLPTDHSEPSASSLGAAPSGNANNGYSARGIPGVVQVTKDGKTTHQLCCSQPNCNNPGRLVGKSIMSNGIILCDECNLRAAEARFGTVSDLIRARDIAASKVAPSTIDVAVASSSPPPAGLAALDAVPSDSDDDDDEALVVTYPNRTTSVKFPHSLWEQLKPHFAPLDSFSLASHLAAKYPTCTNSPCPNPGKIVGANEDGEVVLCDRCSGRTDDSDSDSDSDSSDSFSSMPPLEGAPPTRTTMDKTKAYRVLLRAEKLVTTSKERDFYPAIIIPCLIHKDMPAALVSPATYGRMNELHGLQGKYASRYALLDQFPDRDILFEHPLLPGLHVLADHHGDDAWQRALARFGFQSERPSLISALTGRF